MTDPASIAAIEEDNVNLFAHVFELKKQCAALMQERDITLSAIDALQDESMILRELAHCVYMFRDATGRAEAYPGEHLALKRQLWGAHDRWLRSTQESRAS